VRDWKTAGELASLLGISRTSFLDFVAGSNLEQLFQQQRIRNHDLPELLARYKAEFNLSSKCWPVPEWLSSASGATSQTLVEMYHTEASFPSSLPPSQGKILYELILENQPENVIEIGCFIGISSLWIASALEQLGKGHVFSVDLFAEKTPLPPAHWGYLESPLDFASEKAEQAGLSNRVDFIQSKSGVFGKNLRSYTNAKIDFLFIDGDHRIGGCIDDLITFYPHVTEGGKILLHDTNPEHCAWQGPRYLLDNVFDDPSLFDVREIETEPNFGMALITKLRDSKHLHPWHSPTLEFARQTHKAKVALGYSWLYQDLVKVQLPALEGFIRSKWK
jgi:predicted O-methyltransferase YrrM